MTAAFPARLRRRLFGISLGETRVVRRGFAVSDETIRTRIEQIGATFVEGYHAALLETRPAPLAKILDRHPLELCGFAFEGAAMGLAIADFLTPWRNRFQEFLAGPGDSHAYMLHVGAGWALARLPVPLGFAMRSMDPLLRWLVPDGYGFHQGYFQWPETIVRQRCPAGLRGYAPRAFDQGVGRSLWFVKGADPAAIATVIAAFPAERHADLWSGVGLASAYAGGVADGVLQALKDLAGKFRPDLAQGAAFAAKARQRADNPAPHTEAACRILCGVGADEAAAVTDRTLEGLPADAELPSYEFWRQRVRNHFAAGDAP